KDSVELVQLRATEKQLAKLRKFQEALRAKATADALEEQEKNRSGKEEENRKAGLMKQLESQQQNEMSILIKRIDKERKERAIQRGNDTARLEQRFHNLLREHKAEQKLKYQKLEQEETKQKV
ncbi:MAG: hypothetical protein EZS28_054367, partial [Streblomastix strix]